MPVTWGAPIPAIICDRFMWIKIVFPQSQGHARKKWTRYFFFRRQHTRSVRSRYRITIYGQRESTHAQKIPPSSSQRDWKKEETRLFLRLNQDREAEATVYRSLAVSRYIWKWSEVYSTHKKGERIIFSRSVWRPMREGCEGKKKRLLLIEG